MRFVKLYLVSSFCWISLVVVPFCKIEIAKLVNKVVRDCLQFMINAVLPLHDFYLAYVFNYESIFNRGRSLQEGAGIRGKPKPRKRWVKKYLRVSQTRCKKYIKGVSFYGCRLWFSPLPLLLIWFYSSTPHFLFNSSITTSRVMGQCVNVLILKKMTFYGFWRNFRFFEFSNQT